MDVMQQKDNAPARPWARARTLTGASVLVFDIDNALLDLVATKRRAIQATLERLHKEGLPSDPGPLTKEVLDHALEHGLDAPDLIPTFLRERMNVHDDRMARRGQHLLERFEPGMVELFPDTIRTLDTLRDRGYRMYAITAGTRESVNRRLSSNGLTGRFDDVLSYEGTRRQNHPISFERILERENIPGKRLLSVGSHPASHVSQAIELGGQGVLAAYGYGSSYEHAEARHPPTATIGSIAELLTLLPARGEPSHPPLAFA